MWNKQVSNEPKSEKIVGRSLQESALDQAIEGKDLEYARELILQSNHIKFDQTLAFRLLKLAIELKHEQYINDLILQIPNFNVTQESGELIWQVLTTWDTRIATMLIKAGANVNVLKPNDPKRLTLLQYMATLRNSREDYYNLALLMLDDGADVNAVDEHGNTALHYAVTQCKSADKYSFVLAVELVLRGARVDVINRAGISVIHIATMNFWFDGQLCPLLIALADVDDDVKCRWIIDALVVITKKDYNDSVKGLSSLLELGFPILKLGDLFVDIWQPLYFAVSRRKNEQLKMLLDYGANVNFQFRFVNQIITILHVALYFNSRDIINTLITRGADIHAIDVLSKEQPIHVACHSASIENVRLLLRLGAFVNIVDKQGKTPYSMINSSPLSDNLRECLIERFAVIKTKGVKINKKDWKSIHEEPRMLRYYNRCLGELQKMKTIKINHSVTLFCVLTESVANVSCFARNAKFAENFYGHKQKIKAVFPLYFRELEYKVKMAEMRKDLLISREEALLDTLILPQLVATKIVKYSFDDLDDLEKLYHVSMIKL